MDSSEIPDKIDFDKKRFTKDEITKLKKRYVSILDENLEESSFNKEKINSLYQSLYFIDISYSFIYVIFSLTSFYFLSQVALSSFLV